MKPEALAAALGGLDYSPLTSPKGGRMLYEFVLGSGAADVLELGFAHGTSSCYIAAALDERGAGALTTIDRASALERRPNIRELLDLTGLGPYVRPIFAETSYNWELMKLIEEHTERGVAQPCFDFCFVDGAHTWDDDGLAFFLVDKLLRPDGWILFDDLHWRYADSPTMKEDPAVRGLPEDQRATPQMMKVFSLLVFQHPQYDHYRVHAGWGWAHKEAGTEQDVPAADLIDRLHAMSQTAP